ncbi:MAG: hypothetical protein A2498_01330 [Lentisphaerae bacterium RIFOXYC12_FULL_60_16]|nr:MAG: hypothetical protein A2498_01330 [Lentisphaerae bacterium RIFOXYC12_FULL_60_16]OGV78321.1 MAG: hypothetical protein A2340_15885 [Lentisphaerae bacterium RIFOXYB12_FULL_60_10]
MGWMIGDGGWKDKQWKPGFTSRFGRVRRYRAGIRFWLEGRVTPRSFPAAVEGGPPGNACGGAGFHFGVHHAKRVASGLAPERKTEDGGKRSVFSILFHVFDKY